MTTVHIIDIWCPQMSDLPVNCHEAVNFLIYQKDIDLNVVLIVCYEIAECIFWQLVLLLP